MASAAMPVGEAHPDRRLALLIDDLAAEHAALDEVVASLAPSDLDAPTASPGWRVREQLAHLRYFDGTAALAIRDVDRFRAETAALMDRARTATGAGFDALTLDAAALDAPGLVAAWRDGRRDLLEAARHVDEGARIPWYGPSMGARSFLTARLMETWAHGTDIVDAVAPGHEAWEPTGRLRHIAQLGVITRGWSYANRGLDAPEGTVAVVLTAPSGDEWRWPEDPASDPGSDATTDPVVGTVSGPAEDFCRVVTQRRHLADTSLVVDGAPAREWMAIAQVFAGGATDGPAPRSR